MKFILEYLLLPPSKNWKSFVWLFKDILFIHQTSILTVNCCTTLLPSRKENYCLLPQIWMTYLLYRKLMLILLTVLFTCDANAAGWAWRIEIFQIDFLCVSIVFIHTVHSSTVAVQLCISWWTELITALQQSVFGISKEFSYFKFCQISCLVFIFTHNHIIIQKS